VGDAGKVYIVDQVVAKPGRAKEFLQLYQESYVPAAKARGMMLEFTWAGPPMWLKNQSNVLYFIWSTAGVAGWWSSQMKARLDDTVGDWWKNAQPLVASRRRDFVADVNDVAGLCDV
jgi:hypothetical protein